MKHLHSTIVICGLALATAARAQDVLDVLDGETLYDGGSLLTIGFELDRGEELRRGSDRIADPDAGHESMWSTTLGYQYGLRHDLQIGFALPFRSADRRSIVLGSDQSADGIGDLELLGKWRFYRWDTRGEALNVSLIAQLGLPTGDDDARVGGIRLEPELQPGSGGVDPALGLAATYEPRRWRFNAALLHRWRTDTDGDDFVRGDEWITELAVGNRFWLEPYPGPFMRADLITRYYHEDAARAGTSLSNTGGERATIAATWAFRPRPSLDFQLSAEIPVWQRVRGTQFGEDWSIALSFGYRF